MDHTLKNSKPVQKRNMFPTIKPHLVHGNRLFFKNDFRNHIFLNFFVTKINYLIDNQLFVNLHYTRQHENRY